MIAVQFSRACGLWALVMAVMALAGAFLCGAVTAAAYLSDVRADCADRRAEALDTALRTKNVLREFWRARGMCLTDPRNSGTGTQTAYGP